LLPTPEQQWRAAMERLRVLATQRLSRIQSLADNDAAILEAIVAADVAFHNFLASRQAKPPDAC